MTITLAISFLAAFLTTCCFIPQALTVLKCSNTKSISLLSYSLFCLGVVLWFVYGILSNQIAIIVANGVTFILVAVILFKKIYNVLRGIETKAN